MRKLTQRSLILGAAEVAIISAVAGVDLVGEAHADPTPCLNATSVCQPRATNGSPRPYTLICQPAGPKSGALCHQVSPRAA
jgi:hypothetical protein